MSCAWCCCRYKFIVSCSFISFWMVVWILVYARIAVDRLTQKTPSHTVLGHCTNKTCGQRNLWVFGSTTRVDYIELKEVENVAFVEDEREWMMSPVFVLFVLFDLFVVGILSVCLSNLSKAKNVRVAHNLQTQANRFNNSNTSSQHPPLNKPHIVLSFKWSVGASDSIQHNPRKVHVQTGWYGTHVGRRWGQSDPTRTKCHHFALTTNTIALRGYPQPTPA